MSRLLQILLLLSLVAAGAIITFGVLQFIRGFALVRVSGRIDRSLSGQAFARTITP